MFGTLRQWSCITTLSILALLPLGCDDNDDNDKKTNGSQEQNGQNNQGQNGQNNQGQNGQNNQEQNGQNNQGQNGQNDQEQNGCGDITQSGQCTGTTIYYCENGVLQSYDCSQDHQICGELSDETHSWYGCTTPTEHGGDTNPAGPVTAEDWARARIAGTVSTEEAFNAIAYNGGFPVITDDNTVIFMHWYEGGNWSVAGDFNSWSPASMTNNGDIWYTEVPMPDDVQTKNYYKFVKDGTDYQADPWSLHYTYTDDGEISYISDPHKAHLMRWNNFKSPQGLPARTLRIYVPDGEGPFDVLYAHDGQNLFGTGTAGYGSWKVEDNMVRAVSRVTEETGSSPTPVIVVGIDNNPNERLSEYAFSDEDLTVGGYGNVVARGDDYVSFVHDTVRPFIESKYNLTDKVGLMGSSMGGLISLYIAHKHPDDYDAVLALSPTTAWGRFSRNDGQTIEDIYASAGHRNYALYLDNGGHAPDNGGCPSTLGTAEAAGDEFDRDCYCFTRSFVDRMNEIGYTWDVDLFHHFQENAPHNETAWAARLEKPLAIFMTLKK